MIRSLRRAIRPLLERSLGLLFSTRWIAGPHRPRPERIARILVIRIDERVGNLLLTTPLLDALTRRFPEARIDVLAAESKRSVIEGIANVVSFEKRRLFLRPLAFLGMLLALRRARYDVAIDASHWHRFSLSSAMLLAWTGAPLRIAHERGPASEFATDTVSPPRVQESEIRTKLGLMSALGVEPGPHEMRTELGGGSARQRIDAWLEASSIGAPIVAILPGGRKADHRVEPEVFSELALAALGLGAKVVIAWGPGERALAEDVARASGAAIAPPTDLGELAALIRRAAVTITNDTGPMHLSVACGSPTIALFSNSDPIRWGHSSPPHVVVVATGRTREAILDDAKKALSSRLATRSEVDASGIDPPCGA